MEYQNFRNAFMAGVIPPWEPVESILTSKHIVFLERLYSNKFPSTKAYAYAVMMGKNWSIDQDRHRRSMDRRAAANKAVAAHVAVFNEATEAFLLALDEVEATSFSSAPMVEGAEIVRRLIAGESVPELLAAFGIKRDALYKRVSRVRKAVSLTGMLSREQESILRAVGGSFRSSQSIGLEVKRLRMKIR